MGPVIEGIPQRVGDRFGPLEKLLPVVALAGDVFLGDALGTEGAPLVVVAFQPGFGEIGELVVVGDLVDRQVAVVIKDGHVGRIVEVQSLRGPGGEQEVVVHEHDGSPFKDGTSRERGPPVRWAGD